MSFPSLPGWAVPPLSPREATFEGRGFEDCEDGVRRHLEAALGAFVAGVGEARREADDEALARRLRERFDDLWVGIAFEGAGCHRAALDLLTPWPSRRLEAFTHGAGRDHDYIASVGAGLALARLPWGLSRLDAYMASLDPLLAWCVPDGAGFYHGIFHHRRYADGLKKAPGTFGDAEARLFDAGLGRSFWWVHGASPRRIRRAVDRFPAHRREELWFGVGLASAYVGGVDAETLRALVDEAGDEAQSLRAGIPFACRLRQKGGNPSELTELAARTLLGTSGDAAADRVAGLAEEILGEGLPETAAATDAYSRLRQRLEESFDEDDPRTSTWDSREALLAAG